MGKRLVEPTELIRLDEALARWAASAEGQWSPERAREAADRVAAELGLNVLWEPGDEEWILLADEAKYQGMLSIKYPLALLTPFASSKARDIEPALGIVEITDFLEENLSAKPELLKASETDDERWTYCWPPWPPWPNIWPLVTAGSAIMGGVEVAAAVLVSVQYPSGTGGRDRSSAGGVPATRRLPGGAGAGGRASIDDPLWIGLRSRTRSAVPARKSSEQR